MEANLHHPNYSNQYGRLNPNDVIIPNPGNPSYWPNRWNDSYITRNNLLTHVGDGTLSPMTKTHAHY